MRTDDKTHSQAKREGIWPSERTRRVASRDGDISIKTCADTILATFDAASVAKQITDDLFPVAQGVKVTAPGIKPRNHLVVLIISRGITVS